MATLPSGLPEHVHDDEDLARFLTQSSQFNQIMAKPAAFLPSAKDRETSVSRHGREPAAALWELGRIAAGDRKLYGAAVVKTRGVRKAELDALAAEPPPRHAVIVSWPWHEHDPELQKARQKECAAVIASEAGPPLLLERV